MNQRNSVYQKTEIIITRWMARNGIPILRISIGIIYIWFGVLKFFEGASPAESLAIRTISVLTFDLFADEVIITGLAILETVIGAGLVSGLFLRGTLLLLYLQLIGTFTPILIFPGEVFTGFPFGLTLEGQYIVKNLITAGAGIVLGATVRGGKIVTTEA